MSQISKAGQEVDITKIAPQQLQELAKAIEEEIRQLSVHYQQLVAAIKKFTESKQALSFMDERGKGAEVLVPLTSSLYVPGVLEENSCIMLEVGAGYFIEKDTAGALDYCERKQKGLQENTNKVGEIIAHKKMQLGKVTNEY